MINIETIKREIEDNTLVLNNNKCLIFIGKDISSEFIFNQYCHYYADLNNFEISYVEELFDNIGFFDISNDDLIVYKTDELTSLPRSYAGWVYCKTVSAEIKSSFNDIIIELPKLEKWQIIDYITTKNGISIEQSEQLYGEYNNIYKLDIEASKLGLFENNQFDNLLDQLISKEEYEIFDLTNALLQRNINKLRTIYLKGIKVDPFAFMSLLIKNFKQVIDIQLARNATAESVGVSGKQFWAIQKFNCNRYSKQELIYIYNLLTSLDLKIKTGKLNPDTIQDYVVFKIISLGEK